MSRILYVDDDEALGFLMARVMQEAGHDTATCTSGADALALLAQQAGHFDLVVSDMNMPGLSGLEFAVAALTRYPGLALVLVSGAAYPDDQQRAQSLGVRKILRKPNGINELVKELLAFL